jgi:hypothetical protein
MRIQMGWGVLEVRQRVGLVAVVAKHSGDGPWVIVIFNNLREI